MDIHICCKVKNWSKLRVKNWSKFKVKNWSKLFCHCFPHFYSVLGVFLKTQIVSHCAKIVFLQDFGHVKNEVFEKKIAFFVFVFFCVGEIEIEKRKTNKMEKAPKNYKMGFFSRWSSKNVKNQKNGFLAKLAWHDLCQEGRKTRIFVHTICFGQIFLDQNSVNREKL